MTPPLAVVESVLPERAVTFDLPPALEATQPPEVRGRGRDDVRLLVAWKHDNRIEHHRFRRTFESLRRTNEVVREIVELCLRAYRAADPQLNNRDVRGVEDHDERRQDAGGQRVETVTLAAR